MEVVAKSKFIRMTPRKLRLVADYIRGSSVQEAVGILRNLDQRAAQPILLTLKQAIGNAVNNFDLDRENLKIKILEIGKGPIYKRWRFVGRGRVHQIQKRTSHIKVILEGKEVNKQKVEKQGNKRTKEPLGKKTKPLGKQETIAKRGFRKIIRKKEEAPKSS